MKREFVEVELFAKTWKALGLSDSDLRELQDLLLVQPKAGTMIRGASGARKLSVAFPGKGKSGSGRVIYVDFAVSERIYLLMAYPKGKHGTLTDSHKKAVYELISELRKEERKHGKQ